MFTRPLRASVHTSLVSLLSFLMICSPVFALPPLGVRRIAKRRVPAKAGVDAVKQAHKQGELLVKFRDESSESMKQQIIDTYGKASKKLRGRSKVQKLTIKDTFNLDETLANMRQLNAIVEWVEPNFTVSRSGARTIQSGSSPNDPRFGDQWALANGGQNGGTTGSDIDARGGWQTTTGSHNTIIAVIDTGVDANHPDLVHNLWVNRGESEGKKNVDDDGDGYTDDVSGWNFVSDSPDITDDNGHGTQMAGIIAAEGNNSAGISGVMWQASIMPLKALDNTGTGQISDVVEAIDYAIAHGASVINCSFGTDGYSQALLDAINRAAEAGVLVAASAGNDSNNLAENPYYPASYSVSSLISVAATTNADQLASFSNWGAANVQIGAPGVDVLTTQRGGSYITVTGTSAAAPLVAGVAGLLKTIRPWVSAQTLRQSIEAGARQVPALNGKVESKGVLDAGGAIAAFLNTNSGLLPSGGNPPPPPPPNTPPASGPSGNVSLDSTRNSRPNRPEPVVHANTLPPAGYHDPVPTQSSAFASYYTETSKPGNATGVAGSLPLQSVDPTAGSASVGGISINLDSLNFNFTAPVVSLAGRAGLNLSLGLSYNSRVWTKDPNSNRMSFNADWGKPAPGWRIGFGAIQMLATGAFTNGITGASSLNYIAPDGTRHVLKYVDGTTDTYRSYDSSYLEYHANASTLWTPDGTQIIFYNSEGLGGGLQLLPTWIKDRHGNFITIFYRYLDNGDVGIDYVIDTAGRRIDFYYQSSRLLEIRQNRNGTIFKYVVIDYDAVTVSTDFQSLTLDPSTINGTQVYMPTRITYPTGQNLRFYYTSYAQMYLMEKWVPTISGQGNERRIDYTLFDFRSRSGASYPSNALVSTETTAPTNCPVFAHRSEVAENWQNATPVVYSYWPNSVVDPLNRTYAMSSAGLVQTSSIGANDPDWVYLKTTTVTYTDDGLGYLSNPRVVDSRVADSTGNTRRTHLTYAQSNWMWVPTIKDEYQADATTIYRRTTTDYTSYLNQHILALPQTVSGYAGAGTTLMAKTTNNYDETGTFTDSNGLSASYFIDASGDGVIQHDTAYGTSVTQRGNRTSVTQYSVINGSVNGSRVTARTSYDTNGNVRSVTDAAGNRQQFTFNDNYFQNGKPSGVGQTEVYRYTTSDPTGFVTWTYYDYFTGNVTRAANLPPGASSEQQVTSMGYDFADRMLYTVRSNAAQVSFGYYDNLLQLGQWDLVDQIGPQTYTNRYSFKYFDGAGRVYMQGSDHPDGVPGKYSGQRIFYDLLGQQMQVSNPASIDGSWNLVDEDATWGWRYTTENYDLVRRPQTITRPDQQSVQYTYSGCGCAGGTTITRTDEMGSINSTLTDFLGRLQEASDKSGLFGNIYSKAVYSYDALDHLVSINYTSDAKSQVRTFVFDGYGRLQSETTPEAGTVSYTYTANDQLATKTDARGMTATFAYNTRNLVTGISYNDSGATPSVAFSYDPYGARQQMTDGEGTTTYSYNSVRRLESESRTFSGLPGQTFTLSYTYNYLSQVKQVNYSATGLNSNVNYAYNAAGGLAGVGTNLIGSDPAATTNVASGFARRGSGKIKAVSYGNGRKLTLSYETPRQQLTELAVRRSDGSDPIIDYSYSYYNDARKSQITDNVDAAFTVAYGYDEFKRLTSAYSTSAYTRSYTYDAFGNLRSVAGTGSGEAVNYTLNYATNASGAPATNRIANQDGILTFGYDAAGNMTQEGGITYSYDAASRLKEVGSGGQNVYGYDGDGNRVRSVGNGYPLFYLWSTVLGQNVLEATPYQPAARVYVYAGKQLLALRAGDNNFYWVHGDHLGSMRKLTGTDGSVTYRIEYDPHGQTTLEWGTVNQYRKFTGYERDWATNLDYARARMYHHNRGRFMQADPAGHKAADLKRLKSLNRYSYVENDPISYEDPSGSFLYSGDPMCMDVYLDGFLWFNSCGSQEEAPIGEPYSAPPPEPEPVVTCTVAVGITNIVGLGVHSFIILQQSDQSSQEVFEAAPSDTDVLDWLQDKFGVVKPNIHPGGYDVNTAPVHMTFAGDCSWFDDNFRKSSNAVRDAKKPYWPLSGGPNSNSYVYTLLLHNPVFYTTAGAIGDILRSGLGTPQVFPGWGNNLIP